MRARRYKKVALVLGSGAARGWAHLGVIRALEEEAIPIHCVVGTSIGALVGASFASGRHQILQDVVLRLDWRRLTYLFLEVSFPRSGLIEGEKIERFARQHMQPTVIEKLPIEFRAVATDILTGQKVVIGEGDLVEAIRASLSVAGIFTPVCRGDAVLVDGGLVDPLPVDVARDLGADFVIASEVNLRAFDQRLRTMSERIAEHYEPDEKPGKSRHIKDKILERAGDMIAKWDAARVPAARRWLERGALPNVFEVVTNAHHIMEAQVTRSLLEKEPPDLLIQPPVEHLSSMDYHRAGAAIRAGYAEAKKRLSEPGPSRRKRLR